MNQHQQETSDFVAKRVALAAVCLIAAGVLTFFSVVAAYFTS